MAITIDNNQAPNAFTTDAALSVTAVSPNRRIFYIAGWKDQSTTGTLPVDWTEIASFADGAVASGNGVGSMRIKAWYKDEDTSNPLLDVSATVIGGWYGIAIIKGSSETWGTPAVATAAITNWTTSSQTVSASAAVTVPDASIVIGAAVIRDDSATFTRPTSAIDAVSGVTWNGNFVHASPHLTTTTGNDAAMSAGYRLVTTGGSTVTLQQTATLSAAETGSAIWIVQGLAAAPSGDVGPAYVGGGYYG